MFYHVCVIVYLTLAVGILSLASLLALLFVTVRVHKSLTLMHTQSNVIFTNFLNLSSQVSSALKPGEDGQSPLGQSVEQMVILYADLTATYLFDKFKMSSLGEKGGEVSRKSSGKGGFAGLRDMLIGGLMEHIPGLDKIAQFTQDTGGSEDSGGNGTKKSVDFQKFNRFGG